MLDYFTVVLLLILIGISLWCALELRKLQACFKTSARNIAQDILTATVSSVGAIAARSSAELTSARAEDVARWPSLLSEVQRMFKRHAPVAISSLNPATRDQIIAQHQAELGEHAEGSPRWISLKNRLKALGVE